MMRNFFLFLILPIFTINMNSVGFAAEKIDNFKITKSEKKEAEEIAVQFTLRFAKTKDIAPFVKDYYRTDFMDGYKKEFLKIDESEEEDAEFIPYLSIKNEVFKRSSSENLQKFYIASHNYFLSHTLANLQNFEKTKGSKSVKIISPALRELFEKNPSLLDLIDFKRYKESKPISSLEEMNNSINVLNEGAKIFNRDNPIVASEAVLKKWCGLFFKGGMSKTRVNITDEEYFGIPKGTRVVSVVTPLMLSLSLSKKEGKLKIDATLPYTE